jgi:hypothetical protein
MTSGTYIAPLDVDAIGELNRLLRNASGTIRLARIAYGPELQLEIEPLADKTGDGGTWGVGSQGSEWRLVTREGEEVFHSGQADLDEKLADELTGSAVSAMVVSEPSPNLVVCLEDGRRLTIEVAPLTEGDEDKAPRFWEVLTPDGQVVSVGPGDYWRVYPSDMPESDLPPPAMAGDHMSLVLGAGASLRARRAEVAALYASREAELRYELAHLQESARAAAQLQHMMSRHEEARQRVRVFSFVGVTAAVLAALDAVVLLVLGLVGGGPLGSLKGLERLISIAGPTASLVVAVALLAIWLISRYGFALGLGWLLAGKLKRSGRQPERSPSEEKGRGNS